MTLAAVAAAVVLVTADAHARAGGGFSGGSRDAHVLHAAGYANCAECSRANAAHARRSPERPGTVGQTAARPGLFGGGLLGGLAGGFLGAGLFGLLFGHGIFGGMGGFASLLGLMLQIGLVVIAGAAAVRLVATS